MQLLYDLRQLMISIFHTETAVTQLPAAKRIEKSILHQKVSGLSDLLTLTISV